jgi:hypothetical protein
MEEGHVTGVSETPVPPAGSTIEVSPEGRGWRFTLSASRKTKLQSLIPIAFFGTMGLIFLSIYLSNPRDHGITSSMMPWDSPTGVIFNVVKLLPLVLAVGYPLLIFLRRAVVTVTPERLEVYQEVLGYRYEKQTHPFGPDARVSAESAGHSGHIRVTEGPALLLFGQGLRDEDRYWLVETLTDLLKGGPAPAPAAINVPDVPGRLPPAGIRLIPSGDGALHLSLKGNPLQPLPLLTFPAFIVLMQFWLAESRARFLNNVPPESRAFFEESQRSRAGTDLIFGTLVFLVFILPFVTAYLFLAFSRRHVVVTGDTLETYREFLGMRFSKKSIPLAAVRSVDVGQAVNTARSASVDGMPLPSGTGGKREIILLHAGDASALRLGGELPPPAFDWLYRTLSPRLRPATAE